MSVTDPTGSKMPMGYQPYERPSIVIAYVVGPHRVRGGEMVGLDVEGLLVPIKEAICFVGVANDNHPGSPEADPKRCVMVTCEGSFVFGFVGWATTEHDLQRAVWAFDGSTVAGAPLRTSIPVGRVVAIERTSDNRQGVRVKITGATSKTLPPLPGKVQAAEEWYRSVANQEA